jgi:hypothetical protein
MMIALVLGHHPFFPSPTATAQLDGIRSDVTTILANLPGLSFVPLLDFLAISYPLSLA